MIDVSREGELSAERCSLLTYVLGDESTGGEIGQDSIIREATTLYDTLEILQHKILHTSDGKKLHGEKKSNAELT
jgi:hypothetical protein